MAPGTSGRWTGRVEAHRAPLCTRRRTARRARGRGRPVGARTGVRAAVGGEAAGVAEGARRIAELARQWARARVDPCVHLQVPPPPEAMPCAAQQVSSPAPSSSPSP